MEYLPRQATASYSRRNTTASKALCLRHKKSVPDLKVLQPIDRVIY